MRFDGVTYPTTESHEGFCKGIAVGMARAIKINLSDYGHHRTSIARRYANRYGESMDASLSLLHAPLGCARCGKRMSTAFTRDLAAELAETGDKRPNVSPQCENCGSKFAYLLFEPTPHGFDSKPKAADHRWDPNESFLQTKRYTKSACQQLVRVQHGILLHQIRILLYLVLILMAIAAVLSIVVLQPREIYAEWIATMTLTSVVIGAIVGRVMGIVGSVLCCMAPTKAKGRLRIISSLALDALSVTLTVAHALAAMINANQGQFALDDDLNKVLNFLTNLTGVASWVMFMMFLIRIGIYLRQWGAVEQARTVIFRGLLLIGSPIVILSVVYYLIPLCDPFAVLLILVALCAIAFAWLIMWCQLMFTTIDMFRMFREAITNTIAESA